MHFELQGKLKIEASLTNFDAIVVPDKTAFFSGENFTGTIILGKKDNTLTADKVIVNGNELEIEKAIPVNDGDEIKLGDITLLFKTAFKN